MQKYAIKKASMQGENMDNLWKMTHAQFPREVDWCRENPEDNVLKEEDSTVASRNQM